MSTAAGGSQTAATSETAAKRAAATTVCEEQDNMMADGVRNTASIGSVRFGSVEDSAPILTSVT